MNNTACRVGIAYCNGILTATFIGLRRFGGPAGNVVGAIFDMNNSTTPTLIQGISNPSQSALETLERAAIAWAGSTLAAGAAVAVLGTNPAGWAVLSAAFVGGALASYFQEDLYNMYEWLQDNGAQLYADAYWAVPQSGDAAGMIAPWTDLFDDAAAVLPPRSGVPIVLDLDGDGVETTGLNDGAYFDHDKNGFAEKIAWAGSDDGLLAWDRNGDGIINDGAELFNVTMPDGTPAQNGFQVLTALDDNKDGKIDINDSVWTQLKVWRDIDGDGYSASTPSRSVPASQRTTLS